MFPDWAAEHQILWTLLSLVMQLNNQANYLGLVFLRIDNIGVYVSLFNLHFTVKQQYLSPRTSTAPRLPVTASGAQPGTAPEPKTHHQAKLGGPSQLPADTSLSLEVTSTAQPGTATLSPAEQEQEGADGGANRARSLRVPRPVHQHLADETTLLSRNQGLQAVSAALAEEHTCPCPQHASFQMFKKKKIENKEVGYKISQSQLCVHPQQQPAVGLSQALQCALCSGTQCARIQQELKRNTGKLWKCL